MKYKKYLDHSNGRSEDIFIAALKDDTKYIVKYVENKNDIHLLDERNQTLLHLATRNKAKMAVELLLEFGVDPNAKDRHLDTPLHIASYMGDYAIVKLLLTYDADPNQLNKSKEAPLHKACLKGNLDTVKELVEHGANIYLKDEYLRSVMHYAVKSKKIKVVSYLTNQGAIVNSLDIKGDSTMHYTAKYSLVSIMNYLLEQGVNPYIKDTYKMTPLHAAVLHPNVDMIDTLINSGLSSYDKSKFNESPYDLAEKKNKYEAVERFTKLKNNKDYQKKLKENKLTFSIISNKIFLANSLLNRKDINKRDTFNNTPLFYAIMNEELFLINELLKKGAKISEIDKTKKDAIHFAVLLQNEDIVKLLLAYPINLSKKTNNLTVLAFAKKLDNYHIIKQLEQIKNNR